MPGLFEQFPHTNLHELNLDWMIDLLNTFKQELEDRAVISVNGMTGEVTLYESENVVLPPLTEAFSWRLVRMMDGQYVGILFQDGHVWLQQGNSTLKLLTTEDIPTSAGVVAINGQTGIVTLTGRDIAIDDSPDADSIRLALETEHTERVNADNAINNAITETRNEIALKHVDTSYSGSAQTKTYHVNDYSIAMVVVTSYAGLAYGAGVWIITAYNAASGNYHITEVCNDNSGATVTVSGTDITVTAGGTSNIMFYYLT